MCGKQKTNESYPAEARTESPEPKGAPSISTLDNDGRVTYDNLIETLLSMDNIEDALKQVVSNGGAPGVDGMTVHELRDKLPELLDPAGVHQGRKVQTQTRPQGGDTEADEVVGAGEIEVAGIRMVIVPNADAFEVEIPEAKAVYMHMMGHDCHSIVAGPGHADAIIANLRRYLDRGFELFLTSHHVPEGRRDAEAKIVYLESLKAIAAESSSGEEFRRKVVEAYPSYSRGNYLDMTAGMFFPQ